MRARHHSAMGGSEASGEAGQDPGGAPPRLTRRHRPGGAGSEERVDPRVRRLAPPQASEAGAVVPEEGGDDGGLGNENFGLGQPRERGRGQGVGSERHRAPVASEGGISDHVEGHIGQMAEPLGHARYGGEHGDPGTEAAHGEEKLGTL